MKTTRQVSFESLSFEDRIKIATQGMSISSYANGTSQTLPQKRALEVERIASEALRAFNSKKKAEIA